MKLFDVNILIYAHRQDQAHHEFYRERLERVTDFVGLKALIRRRGGDDFLKMTREDLLQEKPPDDELALYPTSIELRGETFACEYVFEPGAENDGLTLLLPADVASLVPATSLEWLVPGFYREKIAALLRGLPKRYRRRLVPLPGSNVSRRNWFRASSYASRTVQRLPSRPDLPFRSSSVAAASRYRGALARLSSRSARRAQSTGFRPSWACTSCT